MQLVLTSTAWAALNVHCTMRPYREEGLPGSEGTASGAAAGRRLDDALVALLRSDGKPRQSAITQLYNRYGRKFKGYFRRHGANAERAEDLLQETFIKVIRSIDSWTGVGALEAWLWTVARNTLLSELRGAASERSMVSLDEHDPEVADLMVTSAAGASGDPADADCVMRGLTAFTEKYAEYAHVLERVVVDDWGYDELAQFRDCGAGAAREYLSQCRKRLWQFIAHCYQLGAG